MMKTNSTESSSYSTRGVRATLVPQEEDEPPITTTTRANVLQVMELSEEDVVSVQHEEFFFKGELQPLEYRDKAFAIVFWVQAAALLVTAILMGGQPDPHNDSEAGSNGDSNSSNSGGNLLVWLVGTCLSALAVMGVYLHLLMRHARNMVPISFFAAPLFLIGLAAAVYLDPESDGLSVVYAVLGAVLAVVSLCYYISLKRYMPFAVANLRTALAAIRANQGLLLVAWCNGMAAILLIIVWLFAFLGVLYYVAAHNAQVPCEEGQGDYDNQPNDGLCDAQPNIALYGVFLLSLYWSHQVFQNVLHVVTAGTVGTWWFNADGHSNNGSMTSFCCVCNFRDVCDSLYRALTYSFGSICLGSLLAAILQLLESTLHSARQNRRGSTLVLCILECLVHYLRRWMEYFNAWAMVYVGLYGYDYFTAGKNVVKLFKTTGWTTFIADRLVYRVMLFCYMSVAVLTGGVSILMDKMCGPFFASSGEDDNQGSESRTVAFWLGFALGMFLSSTVLLVVESAARTVIVCFAESPGEFSLNHPDLCEEMMQGWSEAYPDAWASRRTPSQTLDSIPVMADARVTNPADTDTDEEASRRPLV